VQESGPPVMRQIAAQVLIVATVTAFVVTLATYPH
jgi:hypothetical protein